MKALISIGAVLAGVILGFAAVWVFKSGATKKLSPATWRRTRPEAAMTMTMK